jgi:histidinol dehydrogenase
VANSQMLVHEINEQIKIQLENLPRKEFAKKSLENSLAIVLKSRQNTVEMINEYAPEHLILCTEDYLELAEQVTNAGSVFLGNFTPESAGDYASGTNHTLPTNGWAKTYSGVNLDSFMKKITFQELTQAGLKNIGPAIKIMATTEQLEAHKNAVSLRLKEIKD